MKPPGWLRLPHLSRPLALLLVLLVGALPGRVLAGPGDIDLSFTNGTGANAVIFTTKVRTNEALAKPSDSLSNEWGQANKSFEKHSFDSIRLTRPGVLQLALIFLPRKSSCPSLFRVPGGKRTFWPGQRMSERRA